MVVLVCLFRLFMRRGPAAIGGVIAVWESGTHALELHVVAVLLLLVLFLLQRCDLGVKLFSGGSLHLGARPSIASILLSLLSLQPGHTACAVSALGGHAVKNSPT